ncbi:hypothetical protein BJV82DRAFT_644721 [Fennellomyces sp. T-0311]|nr:hypothetical protein BJV82DRAFT_644721 [Fennellomyces sp. T-0311]
MPIKPPTFTARRLLGLPPDSDAISEYLKEKRFPDSTYYSYKSLGLSLCFTPKNGTLALDSIDIYNGHTRDGFQPFTGSEYPYGITPETQAHEIVSQLGEPDRKGGGAQTRLPCWIEYQFNDDTQGGLMIQLHGVDWDDREMGWTSLVLF